MKKYILLLALLMLSMPFKAYSEIMKGDMNGDNYVDVSDVTMLISYVLTNGYNSDADFNEDGILDISDVTELISMVLNGYYELPGNETFTVNGVSFTMVFVEGGTFTMGATQEMLVNAYSNEFPTHQVTLSSYYIGQTEVTQALWLAVMGNNPSCFTEANGYTDDLNRPVETVNWSECQNFIAQLNELTGKSFRMPTEAEWEFAARGGNKSKGYTYSGGNNLNDIAWWHGNRYDPYDGTKTVATKAPNELGIYDMTGNVWDWCQDWYGSYSSEPQVNPTGPATGQYRVFRGGYWRAFEVKSRVSFRHYYYPWSRFNYVSLRLVL